MKFFDREEEIRILRKIRDNAENNAQFTVITGRRRIGKTSLVLKAYEDKPILYFFTHSFKRYVKKMELYREFIDNAENYLPISAKRYMEV